MSETKSVTATAVIATIERLRKANQLEDFTAECNAKRYQLVIPIELYDLAINFGEAEAPHARKGSGVCDPYATG